MSVTFNVADRNHLSVVELSQDNVSMAAAGGSSAAATVTISAVRTGYTPIGIVGWKFENASGSGGANSSSCFPYMVLINSSNEAEIHIRNMASNAAKIKVTAYVLYA